MRDEGIVGAVADAGLSGDTGRGARVLGPPLDVLWIIQPTRIEGRRDHGHQEFYLAQGIGSGGHGVGLEGGPGDRGHARLVLHNPIADPIPDLKATPFHTLSLLAEIGRLPRLTPPACLLLAQSSATDDAAAIIALACCGSSPLSPTALSARYA